MPGLYISGGGYARSPAGICCAEANGFGLRGCFCGFCIPLDEAHDSSTKENARAMPAIRNSFFMMVNILHASQISNTTGKT